MARKRMATGGNEKNRKESQNQSMDSEGKINKIRWLFW